jgi:hypothetical protein
VVSTRLRSARLRSTVRCRKPPFGQDVTTPVGEETPVTGALVLGPSGVAPIVRQYGSLCANLNPRHFDSAREKAPLLRGFFMEAHTGFEPVLREDDDDPPLGRESEARSGSELPADLQRIVERLTRNRGAREPRD